MEIRYSPATAIEALHKGQSSTWADGKYDTTELKKVDADVFYLLNEYWRTQLSAEEQDELYGLYDKVRVMLDVAETTEALHRELRILIAQILDKFHDLDRIHHWVVYDSRIHIPSSIQTSLNADQHFFTEAGTYLKPDYRRLISMAIAMRALVPIWGEYMWRGKNELKTKSMKCSFQEFYAFRLIAESAIYKSSEMEKLRNYVAYNIQSDKKDMSKVIDGVGSEDHVEFTLARVVVRRLAIGDITGMSEKGNIVSFISMYIRGIINRADNNYSDGIRVKDFEGRGDDEDKIAILESYPAHDNIAPTIRSINAWYADARRAIADVQPDLEWSLYEEALESSGGLIDRPIMRPQMAIVQNVLKDHIRPRAIPDLPILKQVVLISVTEAILWKRGQHFFAALVGSYPADIDGSVVRNINVDSRISAETALKLKKYFPYDNRFKGVRTEKIESTAMAGIDELFKQIISLEWITTLPDQWREQMELQSKRRVLQIPTNLKALIANFVIDCIDRSKGQ